MDSSRKTASMFVFFLVGFGIPWTTWMFMAMRHVEHVETSALSMVGAAFCSVGGVAATYVAKGTAGVRELARRCLRYRVSIGWWIYAIFLPLVLITIAAVIYGIAHDKVGPVRPLQIFRQWWLFYIFVFGLFQGPLGEELGWRGFLLPALLEKYSALKASVIVGLVWALWHFPTALLNGGPYYLRSVSGTLLFTLAAIAVSILMTVLFLRTQGSVLLAIVFHGSPIPSSVIVGISFPNQQAPDWLKAVVAIAAAMIVAVALGKRLGGTDDSGGYRGTEMG